MAFTDEIGPCFPGMRRLKGVKNLSQQLHKRSENIKVRETLKIINDYIPYSNKIWPPLNFRELGTEIRGGAKIKGSELGTENRGEWIGHRNLKNLKKCAELIPQKLITLEGIHFESHKFLETFF